jgi:hypothetical protein
MANSLIPPPELAPTVPRGLLANRGTELWAAWMDTCEDLPGFAADPVTLNQRSRLVP